MGFKIDGQRIAEARDRYMSTEDFKSSADPTTLKAPASQRQFLENRLHHAFLAGVHAAEEILTAAGEEAARRPQS